jgi:hypothetical protein
MFISITTGLPGAFMHLDWGRGIAMGPNASFSATVYGQKLAIEESVRPPRPAAEAVSRRGGEIAIARILTVANPLA